MKFERASQGPPAPFIVAAARSGTTLLRLMLDAHPDLAIPPETHFISDLLSTAALDPDPRAHFLREIISHPLWADFRLDATGLRERVNALEPFSLGEGLRVFYQLYAARFGKNRWGDKTPPYIFQMRAIQQALPEASFIHLIRDGRDVFASIKDLWFGPGSAADAARWWTARIHAAREQAKYLPAYLEVHYEDLVTETEAVLRRICDFLALPWDEAMLRYHCRARCRLAEAAGAILPPHRAAYGSGGARIEIHRFASGPPMRDRIRAWETALSAREREEFEAEAHSTLNQLGYAVAFSPDSIPVASDRPV